MPTIYVFNMTRIQTLAVNLENLRPEYHINESGHSRICSIASAPGKNFIQTALLGGLISLSWVLAKVEYNP